MSILDIARSGILSYRSALSVTAENIANVNTEGYVRREISLQQAPGGQTTATSGGTSGQGVRVEDVRRAFDGLVANRLRGAESASASATSLESTAAALETLFLSGAGSVPEALSGFFDAVNALSANPSDGALRQVMMAAGEDLSSAFNQVAGGLAGLRTEVLDLSRQAAGLASGQLEQLAQLNGRMVGSSQGALNPLLDERDRLLRELSQSVGISASFDQIGRVRVTLGAAPGGPLLVEGDVATEVGVAEAGGLVLSLTRNGATSQSRQISGGSLQGLAASLGAVDNAAAELDALAQQIVAEMNAVHRQGLDQTGQPGGDLFALEGWKVAAPATNRGGAGASVESFVMDEAPGEVTLVRDGPAALWRAFDAAGTEIGSGTETVALPGLTLRMTGVAQDGDRLLVTPRTGRAIDMRFVPTTTRQIAAAAATLVSASAGNRGSATATMTPVTVEPPALGTVAGLLAGGGGAEAVSLIRAGVVGYVPAGTKSLELASLGTQSAQDFLLSDAEAGQATRLSFSLGGTLHEFDLAPLAATSVEGLVASLNAGAASAAGETLAALGVTASGTGGRLTLTLGSDDFDAGAQITGPGLAVAGSRTASEPAGGTIQIITREGRHIAGTPLSAAEAALLLTEENGFLPGAVYTYAADPLDAAGGTAYRGLGLDSALVPGRQALSLGIAPPATGTSGSLPIGTEASRLSVDTGTGLPVAVDIAGGTSARRAAAAIGAALDGVEASARTAVLVAAPADGALSFRLTGSNPAPLTISGAVAGGRMDGVAQAVNAVSAATGIWAELSPDGTRLLLVQDEGENISLTSVAHQAGAPVTLQAVDADHQAVGGPVTLSGSADSVRFTGQVRLSSASGFSADLDGTRTESEVDPLLGGLITRTQSGAGAVQRLDFRFDAAVDGAGVSADGMAAQSASARYSVTLGSRSVTLDAGAAGVTDGAGVAAELAALLREGAPTASLTGRALTAPPPDGRSVTLSYEGQSYTLRMSGGSLVVEGGEPGLLTAGFDASNRLQVRAAGSLDGAGIVVESGAAAAFGIAATDGAVLRLQGEPADPAGLPSSFDVTVGGTNWTLAADAGGITLPAGFPGSAAWDAEGRLVLEIPATAGALRVAPQAGARAAGLATEGAHVAVTGGGLVLTATDGAPLALTAGAEALASQRLRLTDLPDEDLIVVMTGDGSLRLAGAVEAGTPSAIPQAVEVRVTDAATGRIEVFDQATGHSIGTRTLGADGSATVAGLRISLEGQAATGDRFFLTQNSTTAGGADILGRLLDLSTGDRATGQGGYGSDYAHLQARLGSQASAASGRVSATGAALEVAERAAAEAGAVDLDAEAARLVEQQQAYQASSQVLSVAQTLFETLLNAL
ncbi:flagellar hook-associated protein FlgK [Cereibacter sphaeroides]|uniref:flagellar hook-associated protein FlgK n=1 Tax=Cereibacter sphaeroides TaxID=1063 RepID=UPI001F1B87D5|nr:flagellar hook-associated protein FlgK [Cereibacter sphaeroides]MCE6953005.1 flagellar hook-associated protein FlgK [Cereibacter sphaeroides]